MRPILTGDLRAPQTLVSSLKAGGAATRAATTPNDCAAGAAAASVSRAAELLAQVCQRFQTLLAAQGEKSPANVSAPALGRLLAGVTNWSSLPLLWGSLCLTKWCADLSSASQLAKTKPHHDAIAVVRGALKTVRGSLTDVCTTAGKAIKAIESAPLNMCPISSPEGLETGPLAGVLIVRVSVLLACC